MASAGLYASLHLIPDNHTNIPPLSFLQAGCPSCHLTNSIKALKAIIINLSSVCIYLSLWWTCEWSVVHSKRAAMSSPTSCIGCSPTWTSVMTSTASLQSLWGTTAPTLAWPSPSWSYRSDSAEWHTIKYLHTTLFTTAGLPGVYCHLLLSLTGFTANTHTQPFYGSVDLVWDNPGEPVPEGTFCHLLDFLEQNKDNTGRRTNNLDGLPPHTD